MPNMKEKATANPKVTERELDEIRVLIEQRSGIQFDESRERFFSTRVLEHMRERGYADATALFRRIASSNAEYDGLLERLLTQETSFFRYPAVYEALVRRILPDMHARKFWEKDRTLRIWSAGCSTGEEPYSIAFAIADALDFAEAWNIEILATDISHRALKHGGAGRLFAARAGESDAGAAQDAFRRGRAPLQSAAARAPLGDLFADESGAGDVRGPDGLHFLHERADLLFRTSSATRSCSVCTTRWSPADIFSSAIRNPSPARR